jgi:hypothetical protein
MYLDATSSPRDYPRVYKVEVSDNGKKWKKPVATGRGNARTTEIQFKPVTTKFIRITQMGKARGLYWSIHELQLLQPPSSDEIKTANSKTAAAPQFE